MKHFFSVALAMIATLSALAVTTPDKVFDRGGSAYIPEAIFALPPELSYGDEMPIFLYTSCDNEEELTVPLERINADLEVVETINIKKAVYQVRKVVTGPAIVSKWRYPGVKAESAFSEEEALKIIRANFTDGFQQLEMAKAYNQIYYFKGNTPLPQDAVPSGFYDEPGAWDTYLENNGTYDAYAIYYSARNTIQFYEKGAEYKKVDYSTTVEYSDTTEEQGKMETLSFCNINAYADYPSLGFPVTQTLFNNDEEYEVVVPKWGAPVTSTYETSEKIDLGEDNWQWVDITITTTKSTCTGYEVKNVRTDATIATFEVPSDMMEGLKSMYCSAYMVGDVRYFVISVVYTGVSYYAHQYDLFYNLGKEPVSGSYAPDLVRKVSVSPTLVNRGENINVSGTEGAEISYISLVGLNGQMERQVIANRSRNASINTADLPAGMHIVGVRTADGQNHTQKVMVK